MKELVFEFRTKKDKNNFDNLKERINSEKINNITFQILTEDKEYLKECLKSIVDFENDVYEENENVNVVFRTDMKMLSTELKIEALKTALHLENCIDTNIILNIFNLIKGYNTLQDSYFEHPDVYFNDLSELLEINSSLNSELYDFSKKLIIYYLAILKSCGHTELDFNVETQNIPFLFQRILLIADAVSLSNMWLKRNIDISNEPIPVVNNGFYLLTFLSNKFNLSAQFVEDYNGSTEC